MAAYEINLKDYFLVCLQSFIIQKKRKKYTQSVFINKTGHIGDWKIIKTR